MMATEATSEIFATSTPTPNDELNITETASQDVSSELPIINGISEKDEVKPEIENVEPATMSAEVSVSGGSDTEASKTEASKSATDEKGHVRTTSTVKKVASFKPVSVNKKFLAAKVTAAPSKLGEKGAVAPAVTPPGSSTLRPRLVAKSGSGLRDSSARGADAANGGKTGAPDASAVWNKNRPAPAVSPKAYTDEELKQQYGIHLATRMKTDDAGNKQANWADIDDDDDDWAPASMEWADGTKVTLPQADDPPPPAPIPVPSPTPKEPIAPEAVKPKSPAPPQVSASPTIKTTGLGSGRTGLVLKGASEKPTLVAKPPGPPTPVKSPWAPLPPVDKSAPIAIDIPQPPQQQQQSRFGQRDPHGFQGMPPPPTKEIAADDFSRSSWREGSHSSRELFDSKSGRYEPVNDARRGSRNEPRHPSLLQRPQHDGPAEPSAAFQTHRATGQEGYGRRRTSSNVSGGSGNFGRRMSRGHDMPPPHDMLNARRPSLAAVSDDLHSPRTYSPSGQYQNQRGNQHQQWQSRASPVVSHPSPQSTHGQPIPPAEQQAPAAPYEDPLEEQKKLMTQKIELAKQRKRDEEAREEAEKQERIRLRLEALGPAPEKVKKETPKEEKAVPAPTQIQSRKASDEEQKVADAKEDEHADSAVKPIFSEKRDRANGNSLATSAQSPKFSQENRNTQSQPWQNNSSVSDRQQHWAPPSSQQASRNVWGPPSNDRTLGNGTFNPELSRLPDMQSNHPGPIGPPGRGNGSLQRGQRESYASRPPPIGPPSRQQAHGGNVNAQDKDRVLASGWGSALSAINDSDRALREKIEKERAEHRDLEARGLASGPVFNDTWREVDFDQDGVRAGVKAKHTAIHEAQQPGWNNQEDASTRPIFEERSAIDEQELARRRHFDSVGTQPQQNDVWRSTSNMNNGPVRGSRFFPNNNRDVRLEEQNFYERPGSPSPPPPTMPDHPAWDGDGFPHVSLPRPSPIVKLPPVLAPIGPPKPASFAAAVTQPALPLQSRSASSHQDVRREQPTAGDWQTRINSLIGRKPAVHDQHHKHEMAVDSSSKHTLEHPVAHFAATVSLPLFSGEAEGSVVSKPAAEICFEEQEMGSLPVVKVPTSAPAAAWNTAPAPKGLPKRVMSTTIDGLRFLQQTSNNNNVFVVRVPGQEEKTVKSPVPRQSSNPRRGGGSRGGSRQASSSHPRGGRNRDASNGFQSPGQETSNVSSSSPGRGRGNRGYSERNWSRQPSTPLQTSS